MFGFLKKIFGAKKTPQSQKERMVSADAATRRALAMDRDAAPEVLYYLASDADASVRRAVAGNAMTPVQASSLLARDPDADVRLLLAARLVALLPGLSQDQHGQLYAFAVQALGMLAVDEVLRVRKALSSALKDLACAPPAVVGRLARDVEREVSEPIIRFCTALSDDDLLDILSGHPEPWVVSAIARRERISVQLTERLVEKAAPDDMRALAANKNAALSEDGLRRIIEAARGFPELHEPVVMRPELTLTLARHLSGFVSEAILRLLEKRSDFDAETRAEVVRLVERRLEYGQAAVRDETPEDKIRRYIQEGKLTPDLVRDAIAWRERRFAVLALSALSRIPPDTVERMIATQSAKVAIALSWRAGLTARMAVDVQKDLAHVPPRELIYAKGGIDYPLAPAEMQWQLELFGIK